MIVHDAISNTFNSLWPNDAIWRRGSGSTLVQAVACCLTAPSHYLNQCRHISKVQWCSSEGNFAWGSQPSVTKISLKIIYLLFYWNLPGTNELTHWGVTKRLSLYRLPAKIYSLCTIEITRYSNTWNQDTLRHTVTDDVIIILTKPCIYASVN